MTLRNKLERYNPSPEVAVTASEVLQSIKSFISNPPDKVTFEVVNPEVKGVQITIEKDLLRFMVNILNLVSRGEGVTLIPQDTELTTGEAANLLKVSRPYLVKILDEGLIPSRKVGIYRRVLLSDLLEYKDKEKLKREEALDELTRLSQEMGLYDDLP
jgi:excisionase family DNA binding protein